MPSVNDDRMRAARALASAARRSAEELERALDEDPRRHDPIIFLARKTQESTDASLRFYSDWLNER